MLSGKLYTAQNNFVYDSMQLLQISYLEAYTFYQHTKRLIVKIENSCMTLEEDNGDELEIEKLQKLVNNSSDTKKRTILNVIKKHKSEIASVRKQTYLRKHCFDLYKEKYRFEIKNKISNCQNNILKL